MIWEIIGWIIIIFLAVIGLALVTTVAIGIILWRFGEYEGNKYVGIEKSRRKVPMVEHDLRTPVKVRTVKRKAKK